MAGQADRDLQRTGRLKAPVRGDVLSPHGTRIIRHGGASYGAFGPAARRFVRTLIGAVDEIFAPGALAGSGFEEWAARVARYAALDERAGGRVSGQRSLMNFYRKLRARLVAQCITKLGLTLSQDGFLS